jgi:type I site-specific restriction-modification system R (restriction) subunit
MPLPKFKYAQPADAPAPTRWETGIDKDSGFVWHTTGSGKTLTSFKASTLRTNNINIPLAA